MKRKLEEMYKAQGELNKQIKSDWKKSLKPYNFESAILVEVGEALESAKYKWWKKQEYNRDNILVELIDVLHFKLSWLYYQTDNMKAIEFDYFVQGIQRTTPLTEIEILTHLGRKQSMYDLGIAFKFYGLSIDDIYKIYMTKYVLNQFRTNNGYKDGTYIKDWNGQEDNFWATKFADSLIVDNKFKDKLYKELETFYKGIKNGTNNQSNSNTTTNSSNNKTEGENSTDTTTEG